MKQVSRSRMGFALSPLHTKREPHVFHFLVQRTSFWIAALSIVAFVAGNMIGQHGWYAFWASVLGAEDDSLIVYTGTVPPIEQIPDFTEWAQYGGNVESHTFRQVPTNIFKPLPKYNVSIQARKDTLHGYGNDVYSVGYMGSYATGAQGDGSHPGIDIRAPEGTPVRSIANGIVSEVKHSSSGFGKVVVIRHPGVPDPTDLRTTTTLYSSYAHLSVIYVKKGIIVQKGEHIADTGRTGMSSGPHLHFQIDRSEAPWHPYWPFTSSEARSAGLSTVEAVNAGLKSNRGYQYTVNPMLYVQANYESIAQPLTIAQADTPSVVASQPEPTLTGVALLTSRREQRLQQRLARRLFSQRSRAQRSAAPTPAPTESVPVAQEEEPQPQPVPVVRSTQTVVAADPEVTAAAAAPQKISSVHIRHDGSYSGRGWEKITVSLLDADGNTIVNPALERDLYLRTAYGTAEFRPSVLSALDFTEGEVIVNMLPRGRRTVVVKALPYGELSLPMVYQRQR